MSRPVKTDSKCPRYWYFRERYLAKKRGETFSGKVIGPKPQPRATPKETMSDVQWRMAKRPPSSVTWNEMSAGRSNS